MYTMLYQELKLMLKSVCSACACRYKYKEKSNVCPNCIDYYVAYYYAP